LLAGTLGAVLAIAAGLIWLGWFSSVLTATTVRVEGVSGAEAKLVREVADVPLGGPLMRVDTDGATARLEAGLAWTDIRVGRSLPHSVVIHVTARTPVLALRNLKGQLELVDESGVAYRVAAKAPKGVPLVTAGSEVVSAAGLRAALGALAALPAALRAQVADVAVGGADQVSFTINRKQGRRTVVWGAAGNEEAKARLVGILLDEPGTTIDVSVPDLPVVRG
jgi:cell division protein FtsQ